MGAFECNAGNWLLSNLQTSLLTMSSGDPKFKQHFSEFVKSGDVLKQPMSAFMQSRSPEEALGINNYYVKVFRKVIVWQNQNWRSLQKDYMEANRRMQQQGLRVTPEFRFMFRPRRMPSGIMAMQVWLHHYQELVSSSCDWVLSGVLQNVVLGNEPGGESGPWRT